MAAIFVATPLMISFGPFLTQKGAPHGFEKGLLYCGFALEFTSQKACADVPIFRRVYEEGKPVLFKDYVVQATDVFTVTEATYERIGEPALGTYVPFQTFLVGLYAELKPHRALPEFMAEFKQHLPYIEG